MKIAILMVLMLGGCAVAGLVPLVADLGAAVSGVQDAITLYQIAKGMGQQAGKDVPAVGATVASIAAVTDPKVAAAQAALDAGSTDARALVSLAAQIRAQANTVTIAAAPHISVVPNAQ